LAKDFLNQRNLTLIGFTAFSLSVTVSERLEWCYPPTFSWLASLVDLTLPPRSFACSTQTLHLQKAQNKTHTKASCLTA
jgi:hypothetical protein